MDKPNRLEILGIAIDNVDMDTALDRVAELMARPGLSMIFTPNAEMVMAAQQDKELAGILNSGDLVVPDGIGIVYASRMYGNPLPERVAGYDLMERMLGYLGGGGMSIYLFGGKPGIADRAGAEIKKRFPGIQVKGVHHGYFSAEDEPGILQDINDSGADVLFAALGSPKQERWIYHNRERLKVKVAMGVGGSLDVLAGEVKRAPGMFRNLGLEWFYRLITQPWRAKRMMALPRFAIRVLMDKRGGPKV